MCLSMYAHWEKDHLLGDGRVDHCLQSSKESCLSPLRDFLHHDPSAKLLFRTELSCDSATVTLVSHSGSQATGESKKQLRTSFHFEPICSIKLLIVFQHTALLVF